MRPMKLAGSELMFGAGCLQHLTSLHGRRATIVTGGTSMQTSGVLDKVIGNLAEAGITSQTFGGVKADPDFETVMRGAAAMSEFQPDLIVGLGGGSPMDAAKAMWIYYEHPELHTLADILAPNAFPRLRAKARMVCIPSTSGSGSEVSRSIVISDANGVKHGIGNMEMMPDIAICDPEVTVSMPPKVTVDTGMDALTHAVEAYVSRRANFLADLLAQRAVKDIFANLPIASADGDDLPARENMLNASLMAALAFTNVSLGIVHSMAHTIGSFFGVAHGRANAVLLPYVIEFCDDDPVAKARYRTLAREIGGTGTFADLVRGLNDRLQVPPAFETIIADGERYRSCLDQMAEMAAADGCTKTSPIIPSHAQFVHLFQKAFRGE